MSSGGCACALAQGLSAMVAWDIADVACSVRMKLREQNRGLQMPLSILPSLPAYGTPATTFSADGTGSHAEGLVIDFHGNWIGNFSKGKTDYDALLLCQAAPDCAHVVSGGNHFVVDVGRKSAVLTARDWIGASIFSQGAGLVIVFDLTHATAYSGFRKLWESERIGWDGIRSVSEVGAEVRGLAYDPFEDTWGSFTLDPATGKLGQCKYPS